SEVEWHIDGSVLSREETLTASETLTIRRWSFALPTTASRVASIAYEGQKWSRLESADGILEVQSPTSSWPIEESVVASGDAPIGRGARRPVPLHLNYEARNIRLEPGHPVRWRIALRAAFGPQSDKHSSTGR